MNDRGRGGLPAGRQGLGYGRQGLCCGPLPAAGLTRRELLARLGAGLGAIARLICCNPTEPPRQAKGRPACCRRPIICRVPNG